MNILLSTNAKYHFSREPRQAAIRVWRQNSTALNEEQVGVVRFGDKPIDVQHDRAIDSRDISLDRRQNIIEQVVVMDF